MWIVKNRVRLWPWRPFYYRLLLEPEIDSNFTWIGPPTWLERPCLTPKVVAKREDMLGHLLGVLHFLVRAPTWAWFPSVNACEDVIAPNKNSDRMSWWFEDLDNVILRWDQIYLKAYQIIFPSSAHWPQLHSRWSSYDLRNEALSGHRWTESSTLMDLHFERHLYLQSNNDMYMWNHMNCTNNHYANIGMSSPYNHLSYPMVSCPHHPSLFDNKLFSVWALLKGRL